MLLFLLKILILLIGLVLAAFQFLLWFVKKKRDKILRARTKVLIAWIILLLIFFVKIVYFR